MKTNSVKKSQIWLSPEAWEHVNRISRDCGMPYSEVASLLVIAGICIIEKRENIEVHLEYIKSRFLMEKEKILQLNKIKQGLAVNVKDDEW